VSSPGYADAVADELFEGFDFARKKACGLRVIRGTV
jgi:hypothetical protein